MTRLFSTSQPQVKSGFNVSWKLFLNLCSWRWLGPSRNLVKYLIPLRLWQPNMLLAVGLIDFKILFLKILGLRVFWTSGSSLFHLIMTERKFFFNYYLAAPRPFLGHYWGDSLTHPMSLTALYIFDPKVTRSLVTKKLCLTLNWGIFFFAFLVEYGLVNLGLIIKR